MCSKSAMRLQVKQSPVGSAIEQWAIADMLCPCCASCNLLSSYSIRLALLFYLISRCPYSKYIHRVVCRFLQHSCMWLQEYLGQEGQPRLLRSHRRAARRSETRSKKQQTKRRGRRQTGRAQAGASAQGGRTLDKYAWLQVRIPL